MSDISTTEVLSIAECGHDEGWLKDMIYRDPSILGLGDLQAVMKEKTQSQGGRLDLLLKNPSDDSMYEVELQLGATDESHIIRTIEYWDNEKRLWPKRSHTAVLVVEKITSRFFNVVHLLSMAVPIIGIQASIVQVGELKALHFTKVIDFYEEPEDDEPIQQTYDERHWVDNYPGALECVRWYKTLLAQYYGEVPTKYFESYVSLIVGGIARVWVNKRKNNRALIEIKYPTDKIDVPGHDVKCSRQYVLSVVRQLKCLSSPVKIDQCIAMIATARPDRTDNVSFCSRTDISSRHLT